jgi:F420-dependent oxidoreductase-like protein
MARMGPAIGLQAWATNTAWPELMAAGRSIDELGFETLWSNDHFLPAHGPESVVGPVDGPVFEGWSTLGGWVAATSRVRLGCLVSGVGYRNPALLVRMATALDHASEGRAALGIGAGWHEREHRMFGFAFPGLRERLDRLEEAAAICRGLLDGDRVTLTGQWFDVRDAVNDPAPIQAHLPLVIGGSGEKRTLRIVARYADWWNADGNDPAEFARLSRVLDEHCAVVGRDPSSIRRTIGQQPPLVRASAQQARLELAEILVAHGLPARVAREVAAADPNCGPLSALEDRLAAFGEAGASLVVFDWPAPFDSATLEALASLAGASAADQSAT